MSDRTLAVFSHPNHEVAVYGLVARLKPFVAYLTDGGGGERLAQTGRGLEAAGVTLGVSHLGRTEESFYQAVLGRDATFFSRVTDELALVIERVSPDRILCDAVEHYNPIHDMALPVTLLAARRALSKADILAVPLVYQASGTPERYVYQRALPEDLDAETGFPLSAEEGAAKVAALSGIYTALMGQMAIPPEAVEECCRVERLVRPRSPLTVPGPGCAVRYDRRGAEAVAAGRVREAITHRAHYLPLVREVLFR
jgi:LmbE family N-acetylglucosaminyl deacetylase